MDKLNFSFESTWELIQSYGLKIIFALITLIIGLWIIKLLTKVFNSSLQKRKVDESLRTFVKSFMGILLKTLLVISVVSMLGVEMTSFVAILGAAGLAVGLALSGTLQNFAGGVMILVFKPFKVGDFIDAQGYNGIVHEIQIFNTILKTPDNKLVIIPNGGLSTGSVTNFTSEATRRVDFTFGIGYGDDIDKARQTILSVVNANEKILSDPEPFVAVSELADSSVNFAVRVWGNTTDYWDIFFSMQENVKKAFDREKISIPFPQTDIHLHQSK